VLDIKDILAGNQNAGARMIRLVEDRDPLAHTLLKALYPHAGHAFIIGITGSPGVGKSSLIDGLITEFRRLEGTHHRYWLESVQPVKIFCLHLKKHSEKEAH